TNFQDDLFFDKENRLEELNENEIAQKLNIHADLSFKTWEQAKK
ncbi:9285_t:CDS:1, partial [Gigaspora rosea]